MKVALLVFSAGVFLAESLFSQSIFSAPGLAGSWNDPGNWTPSGVPDGTGADVVLPATSNINALSGAINVGDLTTGGGVTFNNSINDSTLIVNGALAHATGDFTIQGSMGLVLKGTGVFSGGLALSNGAGVLNQGSLVFGVGTPGSLGFTPVPTSTILGNGFRNEGLASFNAGADVVLNNAQVENTGKIIVATTGDALLQSYTQSEALGERTTILVSGAVLHANTVTLTSGNLFSSGTVNGSNVILGTGSGGVFLSAGQDAGQTGTLTLVGNMGQIGGSKWHFDIGGTTQGSQYDLVNAPQNLSVNGALLSFSLVNGFTPQSGDSFTIISSLNISGGFSNVVDSKVTMPDVGTFDVAIGGNAVVLSNFIAVPEPSTICLMIAGGAAGLFAVRRRKAGR